MLVIPISYIRQFIIYDFIGGSAAYWLMQKGHLPVVSAFIGSMIAPIAMKRAVQSGSRLRRVKAIPYRLAAQQRAAAHGLQGKA